ncbi:MAG TPA: LUD domain-containing protein [Kineosporiaceae bacterium]|nr:LUD domain-containing protein [Kineosporiaceae bacterium]
MSGKGFRRSVTQALANPTISDALGRFSEAYPVSRAQAYEGIDIEQLRDLVAERKGYAALHLDELAEQFTRAAQSRGVTVYRANSAQEARRYVLDLCRERGVRRLVKSKSMATEEIHLNGYLEAAGITCTETDLGEWIIQLCGQRPSHMVMPAIHLTKEQVADIFSKEVDERLSSDIPRLVAVARERLRGAFLEADLGITGANVAIAQTGTLAILSNEGNARLVATLPPIHVAIVGLEKLVATPQDLVPIVRSLPRSATGQLLTSYLSLISGPAQNVDGAPKELHVVLMDNHRSDLAADPVFRQALQCIRCASCLNVCPVFRLVGGHVFGDVYTGGIGTILTAWFDELQKSSDIQGLCIQCGKCNEVCPARIDIAGLIVHLRQRLAEREGLALLQRVAFSVVNDRRTFHRMLRTAAVAQKPLARNGFVRHLPLFLTSVTGERSLPAIVERPLRDVMPALAQPEAAEKAFIFAGCLIDFGYPGMGESMVRVLNRAGIEVAFPDGQTCCGAPARLSGALDVAANNAVDNLRALADPQVRYVVSACPTCTVSLQDDFEAVLTAQGRQEWLEPARELASRVVDFSTLVRRLVEAGRLRLRPGRSLGPITYHDSCHYRRTLHAEQNPRALLQGGGYQLTEMAESDVCCGMGGSYLLKHPQVSGRILRRKLDNIRATGAPLVATDCPGCVLQLRGGLDKTGEPVQVRHTVELLEELLE